MTTDELTQHLNDLEMNLHADLSHIHRMYERIRKGKGVLVLYNTVRGDFSQDRQKKLDVIEDRISEACKIFAIHNVYGNYLHPRDTPMEGLDLTQAIKYHLEGSNKEYVEDKREAIRQARLSHKVKTWILELLEQ